MNTTDVGSQSGSLGDTIQDTPVSFNGVGNAADGARAGSTMSAVDQSLKGTASVDWSATEVDSAVTCSQAPDCSNKKIQTTPACDGMGAEEKVDARGQNDENTIEGDGEMAEETDLQDKPDQNSTKEGDGSKDPDKNGPNLTMADSKETNTTQGIVERVSGEVPATEQDSLPKAEESIQMKNSSSHEHIAKATCLKELCSRQKSGIDPQEQASLPSNQPADTNHDFGEISETSQSPSSEPDHASITSLPQIKNISDENNTYLKVEDSVNNNIQRCESSSSKAVELDKFLNSQSNVDAIPDTSEITSHVSHAKECTVPSIKISECSQERSRLMQYLGLQPVQEGQELTAKVTPTQAHMSKRKSPFGLSFCESFSSMPSLDMVNAHEITQSSPNMSPFEVRSDGSRSPDPPIILAETPVVGSSPPRHDPDITEAAVTDLTPSSNVHRQEGGLLNSSQTSALYVPNAKDGQSLNASLTLESSCHILPEPTNSNEAHKQSHCPEQSQSVNFSEKLSEGKSASLTVPSNVPCPHCHRSFKNRNQLRGHLRWHIHDPVNLLPGRWQKENAKSPSQASALGKRTLPTLKASTQPPEHQNTVNKTTTVTCNLCHKVFGTSSKLRGHMIVHKSKKKNLNRRQQFKRGSGRLFESVSKAAVHQCEVCSKAFTSEPKLRGHMMSHAREVHPRSKGVKRLGSHEDTTVSNEKSSGMQKYVLGVKKQPFKCDICFKTFPTFRQMNGHKGIHSRIKDELQSPEKDGLQRGTQSLTSLNHDETISTEVDETAEMSPSQTEKRTEVSPSKPKKLCTSLKYQMQGKVFKCSQCYLVFATRHRVRKHLRKVHSTDADGSNSYSEEKVDGCKFCEVFKKRGRGRPKRGENTLIRCAHGKMVVGYNLSTNSEKERRKIRLTSPKTRTEADTLSLSPENVLQQKCTVKLSPVNVENAQGRKSGSPKDKEDIETINRATTNAFPAIKRRGRPPKNHKRFLRLPKARKPLLSHDVTIHRTRPSFKKYTRSRKEISYLGRHLKTGWDAKKQRFIGRPYTCHLCKMSYRSERQLCSHMRSHDINIFDLSQLPADQRGIHFECNKEIDGNSEENPGANADESCTDDAGNSSFSSSTLQGTADSQMQQNAAVWNTCFVCKKEFDSDNMFHQHLLGRQNKKCSKEWMKQTFGFGIRSKMTSSPTQSLNDNALEKKTAVTDACQRNENVYVIDKISAGSFQGTGVFSNLQQKVHEKIDTVLQEEGNASKAPVQDDIRDVEQLQKLGHSAHVDAAGTNMTPKKGDVLNAVINRLSQSSKASHSITGIEVPESQPGEQETSPEELAFKCDCCTKAFNTRQKLVLHSRIHKPKVPTIMDHVEYANQMEITASLQESSTQSDKPVDASTSNPDSVTTSQLVYNCTECPKQFMSNHRLANHLKMHTKSTGPQSNNALKNVSQNAKTSDERLSSPSMNVANSESRQSERDGNQEISCTVSKEQEYHVFAENGDQTSLKMADSSAPINPVKVEPQKENDGQRSENLKPRTDDSGQSSTTTSNRPRLLLKLDATTLQRLHDCPDCPKAFKSRRQLAAHRRIHEVEQMYNVPEGEVEGNGPSSEFDANLHGVDATSSNTVHQTSNSGRTEVADDNVYNFTEEQSDYSDIYGSCKICDKVMKKTQLGGHMKSHTKGLVAKLSNPPAQVNSHQPIHGERTIQYNTTYPEMSVRQANLTNGQHSRGGIQTENVSCTQNQQTKTHHINSTLNVPTCNTANAPSEEQHRDPCLEPEHSVSITSNADNPPTMNDHARTPFVCNVCNAQFDHYQQLSQHMKAHITVYPSEPNATLPVAGNNSNSVATSEIIPQPNQTPGFNPRKVYPCELCGFSFHSFRQFRVHISQAHGGKFQYRLMLQQKEAAEAGAFSGEPETLHKTHPHKCDVCGRRFKRLALLIFHLNKLHKGWKQRLCMMNVRSRRQSQMPVTGVSSVQGSSNNAGVDPGELPFTCELCGKSFRMKVQLCGHMKTHGRVGHSPIKISPLKSKGKYTLRKRGKPDFRLSDDWILDMGDEPVPFDSLLAMQQSTHGPPMAEKTVNLHGPPSAAPFSSTYSANPVLGSMPGTKKLVPQFQGQDAQYQMPVQSKDMPLSPPLTADNIPMAPPPPDPSKFITMQMEPLLQQMLHRCLLCHSYFSSQESAVLHCKEVHFKKRVKLPAPSVPALVSSHPLGHSLPAKPQPVPNVQPGNFNKVVTPPPSPNLQLSRGQPTSLPFAGALPKSGRNNMSTSVPSAKTISQTPFNEMLYHVETKEGQTRYVCNTCQSTFLHYNFLMSHLAEHNHLAYRCLQCGYGTYSEKDYQLHCQLHDGQISKRDRAVRPKPQPKTAAKPAGPFPKAVATCHICQRSFVNLKGLQAHMVLHSANFSSISERRNESKRLPRKPDVSPQPSILEVTPEPLLLTKHVEEQTEALDLTVKPVIDVPDTSCEALDLSVSSRTANQTASSPSPRTSPGPSPMQEIIPVMPMVIQMQSQVSTLPDVCQVEEKEKRLSHPTPPPVAEPAPTRKVKNSIRLVGAIDVDVASLENKYSVVTDLLETDSDISPDLPPSNGRDSPAVNADGDVDNGGKSPKKFRNYKCSMCQYSTDFKDSMDRHELKHKKFLTLACHQCSYRTPEKRLMLRHVLTIHEKQKPYQCKLCHYSSAYKHHLKRHHTKRHQQSEVVATTDDMQKLELHSANPDPEPKVHPEPQVLPEPKVHPEPKVYKCKICALPFETSKLLKSHKQAVHKKKKKHKKSNRDHGHSSSSLGESSESTQAAEKIEEYPEVEEPTVLKYSCKLCPYQTNDQNDLTKHLMQSHFGGPKKEGLGDVCTTAQCPQCGYLTGKDQLKVHMQIHDSGELVNCEQCLFKASNQEELDAHVQQKHKVKASAKLVCKMCDKHFWDADDMKQHTEMHLKESAISVKSPFLCNMCPLKLMNRRDALRHVQLHTDRYPFKCHHCIFSCFTKSSLQRHLVVHRYLNRQKPQGVVRKTSRKSLSSGSPGSNGSLPDDRQSWENNSTTC